MTLDFRITVCRVPTVSTSIWSGRLHYRRRKVMCVGKWDLSTRISESDTKGTQYLKESCEKRKDSSTDERRKTPVGRETPVYCL